eukprot:scaffold7017_cov134-Cylindrotheca_fusiformis.AAC.16
MKGNQGLDALAALCGGQSDAPTEDGRNGSNIGGQSGNPSAFAAALSAALSSSNQQSQQNQDAQRQQGMGSLSNQQINLQNITPQQWQQAIAAVTALQGGSANPSVTAQNYAMSSGLPSHQQTNDNSLATMKQLAYRQYVQAQANMTAQQAAQSLSNAGMKGGFSESQQALIMALTGGKGNPFSNLQGDLIKPSQNQVIPSGSNSNPSSSDTTSATSNASNNPTSPVLTSMKPPPPPSQKSQGTLSPAGMEAMCQAPPKIAPMPGNKVLSSNDGAAGSSMAGPMDDKKQQKRAANRRSAQLSRKRKKQFIEELKEENDELRRKEQILRSIPDLIVVFDSSGKLGFVSESVSRFIDMSPEELEGTSFWNRLCDDSVRLLKAAFMDSLAARKPDSDTAPLGDGVWELRLVGKNSDFSIVTLNGVVHFSGEAPECVCCIRPRDEQPIQRLSKEIQERTSRPVTFSVGSRSSDSSNSLEIRANPQQSVISSDSTSADDSGPISASRKKPRREIQHTRGAKGGLVRISDDSVCVSSGSDDGVTSS